MSTTTTVKDKTYRVGTLSAMQQFHVARRLAPILVGLFDLARLKDEGIKPGMDMAELMDAVDLDKVGTILDQLARQIADLDDKAAEYIILTSLTVVERKQGGGEFARVVVDDQFMFEDMDMVVMLTLTASVVKRNLSGFFAALPGGIPGASRT